MKHLLFKMVLLTGILFLALLPASALADAPGSGIFLSTPYTSVVAEKGKTITFSIDVTNRGADYQEIELQVADAPKDWSPVIKSGGYTVKSVMVAPGKPQSVDFQIKSPDSAKSQDYPFVVRALKDKSPQAELRLVVNLQDIAAKGLTMTTQYPQLRGQAGTTFSFNFDVQNGSDQDRNVSFSAKAPDGWDVSFKPQYDSKQVSTVRVKGSSSQSMQVDIAAPDKAAAGEYPVVVQSAADADRAELQFTITIAGQNKITLSTSSGQLSARASVDSPANLGLIVKNNGTAPLTNITFSSSKPDGWDVTFTPDKIETLAAGQQQEIKGTLKPSTKSLAGDYMVTITSSASGTSDSKDIRVTVETPTTWGWIAVGAIVVVLGGLGAIFMRFSRR